MGGNTHPQDGSGNSVIVVQSPGSNTPALQDDPEIGWVLMEAVLDA